MSLIRSFIKWLFSPRPLPTCRCGALDWQECGMGAEVGIWHRCRECGTALFD